MTSPACKVPATALINPNRTLSTRLTTVQTTPPRSPSNPPPPLQDCDCCGGVVLYCTITLTVLLGFASSGSRSGEILALSAKATPTVSKTKQTIVNRANCLECLSHKACIYRYLKTITPMHSHVGSD